MLFFTLTQPERLVLSGRPHKVEVRELMKQGIVRLWQGAPWRRAASSHISYASSVPHEDFQTDLALTDERMNTEHLKMDLVVCSGAESLLLQTWGPHISMEQYWLSFGIFSTLKSLWVWGRKTTYKQTEKIRTKQNKTTTTTTKTKTKKERKNK